jgi:hypothetical protein
VKRKEGEFSIIYLTQSAFRLTVFQTMSIKNKCC